MKVNDKVIVVTGAGGGIGKELVLNLLKKGAHVAGLDMNKERLEDTLKASENNKNLSIHICDITSQEMIQKAFDEIIKKHKHVDGLINNAGIIQPFIKVNDLDYSKINLVMNVNFYGPLNMIKTFLPHLLERPEGHIVNVSSMGGFFPFPGQTIYGASKAAVKLLTEGLYAELLDTNVNVTVVFPGAVETDIAKNSNTVVSVPTDGKQPSMKMLAPNKAAEIIISGMEKNKFQVFAGKDSKMMHFMYKISPKRAIKMISKMMKGQIQ